MLTKMNGMGMSRSLSKEQNTLIVHCTLTVLYAERRGNHSFYFHMGNIPFCFCILHLLTLPLFPQSRKTLLPQLSVGGQLLWHCLNCSVSYLVGMAWICSSMQWQTSRCCSRPSRILNTINAGLRSKLNIINVYIFIIHGMQL